MNTMEALTQSYEGTPKKGSPPKCDECKLYCASRYCVDCDITICSGCSKFHTRKPQYHAVIPLVQDISKSVPAGFKPTVEPREYEREGNTAGIEGTTQERKSTNFMELGNKGRTTDLPARSDEGKTTDAPVQIKEGKTMDEPARNQEGKTIHSTTQRQEDKTTDIPTRSVEGKTTDTQERNQDGKTSDVQARSQEGKTTDAPTRCQAGKTTDVPARSQDGKTTDSSASTNERYTTNALTLSKEWKPTNPLTPCYVGSAPNADTPKPRCHECNTYFSSKYCVYCDVEMCSSCFDCHKTSPFIRHSPDCVDSAFASTSKTSRTNPRSERPTVYHMGAATEAHSDKCEECRTYFSSKYCVECVKGMCSGCYEFHITNHHPASASFANMSLADSKKNTEWKPRQYNQLPSVPSWDQLPYSDKETGAVNKYSDEHISKSKRKRREKQERAKLQAVKSYKTGECPDCGKVLASEQSLRDHGRGTGHNVGHLTCPRCRRRFLEKNDLKQHMSASKCLYM